jgi:hypothetical protein
MKSLTVDRRFIDPITNPSHDSPNHAALVDSVRSYYILYD